MIKSYIKGFFLQLQFLTRIPLPVKINFDDESFARGIIFAPLIGLIIGGILSLIYLPASFLENRLLIAVIIVFSEIIITGGLHLDGLADTCDGLFSGREKEKILEIMKDSRIGTNGAIGIIMLIIFKIGILYSLDGENFIKYLLVFPVLGRMNILWTAGISGYARKSAGMGKRIAEKTGIGGIICATGISLIVCFIILRLKSLILITVIILFAVFFTLYAKKKIGGVTGDIFGAVIEMTETAALFVLFIMEKPIFNTILLK